MTKNFLFEINYCYLNNKGHAELYTVYTVRKELEPSES